MQRSFESKFTKKLHFSPLTDNNKCLKALSIIIFFYSRPDTQTCHITANLTHNLSPPLKFNFLFYSYLNKFEDLSLFSVLHQVPLSSS